MSSLRTHISAIRYFSVTRLFSGVLHSLGLLWLFVQIGAFFSEPFSSWVQSFWWVFLFLGSTYGLYKAWPKLSVQAAITGTDTTIEIKICDILSEPSSFIIGSNTTFDTSIEDGTINPTSIQGQYTQKFCDTVEQLDRDLSNSLTGEAYKVLSLEEKPYGKSYNYEIGTVAKVRCGTRYAYFVSIARLNEHRVASANSQDILDALPKLWEFIRTRGDLNALCCPILGSGFSRVEVTKENLVKEIIKSFVAAAVVGKFAEKLIITISPADFQKGHINLTSIDQFLEHECKHVNTGPGQQRTGTPIET